MHLIIKVFEKYAKLKYFYSKFTSILNSLRPAIVMQLSGLSIPEAKVKFVQVK